MTRREARRLALLIVADEVGRLIDVSDEWGSHPETNEPLSEDECRKVKAQALRIVDGLEAKLTRLERGKR